MNGKWFTLRETREYSKQVSKIGKIKHVDDALVIQTEAISTSPEEFDLVLGYEQIRLAKTGAYERDDFTVPPLRLWFRILDENVVELLYIEEDKEK